MAKEGMKQDKKMMAKAVHKHEKKMHPGKPMTKLAKGGVTNDSLKAQGRNMARASNQRGR